LEAQLHSSRQNFRAPSFLDPSPVLPPQNGLAFIINSDCPVLPLDLERHQSRQPVPLAIELIVPPCRRAIRPPVPDPVRLFPCLGLRRVPSIDGISSPILSIAGPHSSRSGYSRRCQHSQPWTRNSNTTSKIQTCRCASNARHASALHCESAANLWSTWQRRARFGAHAFVSRYSAMIDPLLG
jgi:hypothetical protein